MKILVLGRIQLGPLGAILFNHFKRQVKVPRSNWRGGMKCCWETVEFVLGCTENRTSRPVPSRPQVWKTRHRFIHPTTRWKCPGIPHFNVLSSIERPSFHGALLLSVDIAQLVVKQLHNRDIRFLARDFSSRLPARNLIHCALPAKVRETCPRPTRVSVPSCPGRSLR